MLRQELHGLESTAAEEKILGGHAVRQATMRGRWTPRAAHMMLAGDAGSFRWLVARTAHRRCSFQRAPAPTA